MRRRRQPAIIQPRVIAEVDLGTIARNLDAVVRAASRGRAESLGAVPMVKSNAYGHGLVEVARALDRRTATTAIGVATLDEGVALRRAGVRKPIWVFSDCAPWNETIVAASRRYGLVPVVHTLDDLRKVLAAKNPRTQPEFHLKFNTGMNRLGIDWTDASLARALLVRAGARPQGVCTHFAMGEKPDAPLTLRQARRFRAIVGEFSVLTPTYIHSSNTAAALAEGEGGLKKELVGLCNVIRPGIGIYGYSDVPCAELRPALRLRARVLSSRTLSRGESVGYGATFRVKRTCSAGVLSIGYGDGLVRALSNQELRVGGRNRKVLGRVSMDLTLLQMDLKPGGWVTLLGEDRLQAPQMARAAGTVVYELLTAISRRVARLYEDA